MRRSLFRAIVIGGSALVGACGAPPPEPVSPPAPPEPTTGGDVPTGRAPTAQPGTIDPEDEMVLIL